MARTNDVWESGAGGAYIQTISPSGYDVLINGSNHYLNFNSTVGSSGYGFRENAGTMEFKNSGGSWAAVGGVTSFTSPNSTLTVAGTTSLTADLNLAHANTWTGQQTFNTSAAIFGVGIGINTSTFGTQNKFTINPNQSTDNSAVAQINTVNTTDKGLVIQSVASQTGNLLGLQDSTGFAFLQVVTRTMKTSANAFGMKADFTSAGNGSFWNIGIQAILESGYVGSNFTTVLEFENVAAGTGNNFNLGTSIDEPTGNSGAEGFSHAITTGLNIGLFGEAGNGSVNLGLFGKSVTTKNGGTNIGVFGSGINAGSTPIQIGGYFGIHGSTPTFVSAALIADNGASSSPVFLARVNGTTKFSVDSSGHLNLADAINVILGTTTGTQIGTVGGSSGQKIGFFAATPIVQPLLATGAAHVVDDVITVLQNLGLVRQA